MRARDAEKLHNGDEVIIKKGNIPAKVLSTNVIHEGNHGKVWVELEVVLDGGAYRTVYHDEVK